MEMMRAKSPEEEASAAANGHHQEDAQSASPSSASSRSSTYFVRKPCRIPWRGALALLGGFLIQLTLGSFYSFGNMMTYMTSYMR